MDNNALRRAAEGSGTDNRANPNLGFNPGDLAVATTCAKGARRRRGEQISCTKAIA
jgi:hypothetical protein